MNILVDFAPTGMIPTKSMTLDLPMRVCQTVGNLHHASDIGISALDLPACNPFTGELTCRGGVRGGLGDHSWHDGNRTILARNAGLILCFHELTTPCVWEIVDSAGMGALLRCKRGLHYGRNVQPAAHGS
jgi:hypothetical protein